MKRFFFSLIALAAAAASCTQSALVETPDLFGTEITFNPYTGRTPVTKATEVVRATGLAAAGGFQVIGFIKQGNEESLYMDKLVTGQPTGNEDEVNWNYTGNLFWPDKESSSTLSFVAYSANALGSYTLADETTAKLINWKENNKVFTFTVPDKVSEQIDLLATNYQTGLSLDTNSNGEVKLEFGHLLSKVGFKAQPTKINSDITIKVSKLALCGTMPTQGTLKLLDAVYEAGMDNTIRPVLENKVIPQVPADPQNPDAPSGDFRSTYHMVTGQPLEIECTESSVRLAENNNPFMMIMPNECPDAEIQITYQLVSEDRGESQEINAIVPLGAFNFEQGKAYEFILKISTSSIGFDVEETDWNTAGSNEGMKPEYPIYPERAEDIDYGMNVKSTNSATAAVYVNENLYTGISVEYKLANDNDEDWSDSETLTISDYIPYEIGGPYNVDLTGLESNTKYRYRVIAKNEDGEDVVFDEQKKSFITLAEITASSSSDAQSFSIVLKATWGAKNGSLDLVDKIGFCYLEGEGTDVMPTTRLYVGKSSNATVQNNQFSSEFENLTPNTTYTFRPYCINKDGGVSYGPKGTFKTTIALEIPDSGDEEDDEGNGGNDPGAGGDENKDEPIDPWEGEGDQDNPDINFE